MKRYKIANCVIEIDKNDCLSNKFNKFECNEKENLSVNIQYKNNFFYGLRKVEIDNEMQYLYISDCIIGIDKNKKFSIIQCFDKNELIINDALNVVLYSFLSMYNTILLHASLIDYNGIGILFIGPSGIGKTTQAELWNKYRNALIINGDMVYVQYCDGQFYGFGSPWHGSSPYCLNRKVPLMGIVALEQGDNNQIQLLNNSQRVSHALKSTFLPSWFPEGYDATFNTMSDLFEKIPVYLLKCRADEEAVSLVEKTIIKNETY